MTLLKLKKTRSTFKTIAELSPDIISIINKEGKIVYNSKSNSDIAGKNALDLIHPHDREKVSQAFNRIFNTPGARADLQFRYLRPDGSSIWLETSATNYTDNPEIEGVIAVSRNIKARKKLESDLKEALSIRDEFISIASHEIKTPLASLKMQLQLLKRLGYKPDTTARIAERSLEDIERLQILIEDLLDISQIHKGITLKLEEYNISDSTSDFLESYRNLFEEAKCSLTTDIEPGIIGVWDKVRLNQVILNLLSNAFKYASGSSITVGLKRVKHNIEIIIKDDGPGISKEKQLFIFDRFERAGLNHEVSGLGLGLYISKQIIKAHRGKIYLYSSIGQGCTFTLSLPLKTLTSEN